MIWRWMVGVAGLGAVCALSWVSVGGAQNGQPLANAGYLPKGAIDGAALLGPPPTPTSLRGRADRETFLQTRALQGTPRWALAARDDNLRDGILARFSCAAGVRIGPETPALLKLLRKVDVDVRDVGTPPKDVYNRPRPVIGNTKPVCVPRADWMKTNASYPSGHAMIGWSWAMILSELLPARTDALLQSGRDFAQSRVICGVHYQSDVDAGRMLGSAMTARMHAEPAFQADLAAARAEVLAAQGPPPEGCEAYAAAK